MKITQTDFDQLTISSMNWSESHLDWQKQEGRFEDIDFRIAEPVDVDYSFLRAYWFKTYASVLFAKAFLESLGYEYKVLYDTADDTYVITTNYGGSL
jgi:hypothetical protein